ncbi:MAG TPA: hypothetical protein ENJ19_01485 [Gammaproteobacteria bacterium]|nr:hypothetical protein [Gammaproteobacteria bacterium]
MGRVKILLIAAVLLSVGACTSLSERLAHNLGAAILNEDDPETVRSGAPAFLLLLDSLVMDAPDDVALLRAGADLNGAYATAFAEDSERAARLTEKARDYGRRALCEDYPEVCAKEHGAFEDYVPTLARIDEDDVATLYTYGAAWAAWVDTHSDDWNAVADLAKIEAVMERVIELDEDFEWGRAHLYLAVINSQLPPSLGGRPDKARAHFRLAISISQGKDLIAKVEYARRYARLMFDQALHDRLLQEVLAADPHSPDLVLSNVLAQRAARSLLAGSADYFED